MGSGTSRGKKVAPACVSEVNVTKTTTKVTSPKQDNRPFKPLKIHTILRNARNRAQPDCHSEGHDSDFSREEDDIDGELDTVMAEYEERGRDDGNKNPPKKAVIRSKTYGLCHLRREDEEDPEEPRGSRGGSTLVNKRSTDAFTHVKKHTPACPSQHSVTLSKVISEEYARAETTTHDIPSLLSALCQSSSQGFLTRGALLEAVPASEKQSTCGSCHSSSLTMPVILYDGSEEELMDTIEREFS